MNSDSGRRPIAARQPLAVEDVQTTAEVAPAPDRSALSSERVMPVTSWRAATSFGTSEQPITPLAPATNTLTGRAPARA